MDEKIILKGEDVTLGKLCLHYLKEVRYESDPDYGHLTITYDPKNSKKFIEILQKTRNNFAKKLKHYTIVNDG